MTIFEVHCVLDTSLDAGDTVISKAKESLPAKGLNYSLGEVPIKNVISIAITFVKETDQVKEVTS